MKRFRPRSGSDWFPPGAQGKAANLEVYENQRAYADRFHDRTTQTEVNRGEGLDTVAAAALPGELTAWCVACKAVSSMRFTESQPNWREELICTGCKLNARVRAVVELLSRLTAHAHVGSLYVTEQASPFYRWLRSAYPKVVGSEYGGIPAARRLKLQLKYLLRFQERLRFQDITHLSFEDHSHDLIVSCDVLEHVPDYCLALGEFARTLRPGGWLVLTVPFASTRSQTLVRARIDEQGRVHHLLAPEYHGDPANPNGSLAFYQFGWELLDSVRAAGFARAAWCRSQSRALGIPASVWSLVGQA